MKLSTLAALFTVCLCAQTSITNQDVIKLSKSGLSEDFILNSIRNQSSRLSSDAGQLIELKRAGVSERVIAAVAEKTPPVEPITSYALVSLAEAKFSDGFLLDLIEHQPVKLSSDPERLADLKRGGVSEKVMAAVLRKGAASHPLTADSVMELSRAGFSDRFIIDMIDRDRANFRFDASRVVELKNAGVSERVLSALIGKGAPREIPNGATIMVRLIDGIDSQKANEGDTFMASLEEPLVVNGETLAPKGADATVKLTSEKESGKLTGRTELTVELVSVNVDNRKIMVNSSSVTEESKSRGARTAKTSAVTGAVGAIIGAIAGGGKGAAIGAGAGAAAGAGSQVFMKGQRVQIPSETVLTFTVQSDAKVN